MKPLVAYFSACGCTQKVAECLKEELGADIFEIEPVVKYTKEDLDYMDKNARSTVEMNDLSSRPAIKNKVNNMESYDVIYVGYPVWWNREPSIIDTFLEENDMQGKTIVPFCTSAGSPVDGSMVRIKELVADKANVIQGVRFGTEFNEKDIKNWIEECGK